jgi:hypothetical protein
MVKLNEFDKEALKELGFKIAIPYQIPRAWIIPHKDREYKDNFDYETFKKNIGDEGAFHRRRYNIYYNSQNWKQIVAIDKLYDNLVVIAISADFLAGEDSDQFSGYFIMTKEEYEDIKGQLSNLIRKRTNGIYLSLIDIITQGYKDEKSFRNYFDSLTIDCQDDGYIKLLTPKRKIPKGLRDLLKDYLTYINWDESEYKLDMYGDELYGIMEVIILKDVFESNEKEKERFDKVNKIIGNFYNSL